MKTVFFDVDALMLDYLSDENAIFVPRSFNALSPEELKPYSDADIISVFVHSDHLPTEKLDLFRHLKLIVTRSTGCDHLDLDYCKKRGIEVRNVPGYGEITVAEFSMALLLNVVRKIVPAQRALRQGFVLQDSFMGIDLRGRTLGVIGTGSIGRHMIRLAEGFGMKILAYDPFPSPEIKSYTSFENLLKESDIISLHCPATKENYHLIDEKAFNLMKNGVYLINTARGSLIDTEALYEALLSKKIAGAGLDVLEHEECLLVDDLYLPHESNKSGLLSSFINLKLLQLDNVLLTPHIAFNSIDAIHRILDTTLLNIRSFEEGKKLNQVT